MLIEGVRMADVSNSRRPSPQQQHSGKAGGGTTPPHDKCASVGERLYSQAHVCNHARCAANNPNYNVKSSVPPKKFLLAKKRTYGGVDEKGEKTKSGSSTTYSDHHRDRRHALQSLTNSVPTTENGKVRSNGLRSDLQSVLQNRRAWDDSSSDSTKVAQRKGRPTTHSSNSSHPGSSSPRRSSSITAESYSTAQKSRLSNASSMPFPPTKQRKEWEDSASLESMISSVRITKVVSRLSNASSMPSPTTEQRKEWEDSASPESMISSVGMTTVVSTRRGEDEEKEGHVAAAADSPTASVGSNHDTEISGLKETTGINVEGGMFEQPSANLVGDLQSPASESVSSNNLPENSLNEETTCDSPSLSVDSRPPDSVSESLAPSTPSTNFASSALERSFITTPPSEISSSGLLQSAVGEEKINYGSPAPVDSRPTCSEPLLTSSLTSTKSGPRTSPTSTGRSSRTTPPPPSASASNLARKFVNNLKESSKVGSPLSSSSGASANRPSKISRNPVSPSPIDSSIVSTSAAQLSKKFTTDLQARAVARKASSKGVRSIELRGGKAQSYSTTTVTSWNETTTTDETSVSVSETTSENNVESGLSGSGSGEVFIKPPEQSITKVSQTPAAGPNAPTANRKAPATLKFAKNARSFDKVQAESEKVSLRHGEVTERRLSEEYLTNHALEGVVRKISDNDHRVKVLVHAFETLATLADSEVVGSEDNTLNPQLVYEPMSATTITV